MNEVTLKKEFAVDADDLVDELITVAKETGWRLAKMQYEVSTFTASHAELRIHNGNELKVNYTLTAKWKDLGDVLELELSVVEPDYDWTKSTCKEKCQEIMDSLSAESLQERPFADPKNFMFDEFESKN